MGPEVLAAIITGIASLVGIGGTAAFTAKQNQIMREREDDAVSRRMLDMEQAGINPILAGTGAASSQAGTAPDISGAGAAASQALQASLIRSQRDKLKADTAAAEAAAGNADANREQTEQMTSIIGRDAKIAELRSIPYAQLTSQWSQMLSVMESLLPNAKRGISAVGNGGALDQLLNLNRDNAAWREMARENNRKPATFFGKPLGPGWADTGYGVSASPGRKLTGRGD